MNARTLMLALPLALALAAPVAADEAGCFAIRLGQDTISVDCYSTTRASAAFTVQP